MAKDIPAILQSDLPVGMTESESKAKPSTDESAFRADLPDMARMAAQGMTLPQIAARLGYSAAVLNDAANRLVEVRQALVGGRAKGIDLVTKANLDRALSGSDPAIALYLKARGGWQEPKAARGGPITLNLNTGTQPAVIDVDYVDGLAGVQSDLLDRAMAGDLEGFKIETAPEPLPIKLLAAEIKAEHEMLRDLDGMLGEAEEGKEG